MGALSLVSALWACALGVDAGAEVSALGRPLWKASLGSVAVNSLIAEPTIAGVLIGTGMDLSWLAFWGFYRRGFLSWGVMSPAFLSSHNFVTSYAAS